MSLDQPLDVPPETVPLTALQRESAEVNNLNGVVAHLVGVLYEIRFCTTIEQARTFAEIAMVNIKEQRAGLWAPGPGEDAANWRSR